MTSSSYTYQYVYNGLGDRVRSVLDGVTTTYALDLNSGLTQVLADGSNTYLYGLSRISQTNEETTGYFLGDGLGSVRQVVDPEAAILLNSNVPLIKVSRMLGHSKPSVTLDIYTHLINDQTREAANVMDQLVTPILVEIPQTEISISKVNCTQIAQMQ